MTRVPTTFGPLWSRWVGRFLAKVVWRTEVRGIEHVPLAGAVIVVINHIGLPDGPVVHGVLPRPSHFLIKGEMMNSFLGVILKPAGQIAVHGSGRQALLKALGVLARGGVVGVFPEGHRGTGKAVDTYGGAAFLAIQSGAPVVPATILGTRVTGEPLSIWPGPGRRMLVEFGKARSLELDPDLRGRARQTEAARQVTNWLQEQLASTLASSEFTLPADVALDQG